MSDIVIENYICDKGFTNTNSGNGRWCFAREKATGINVFIKEFLKPVYPADSLEFPETIRTQIVAACEEFYSKKLKLYESLNELNNGNLVVPNRVFRNGNKFYTVSERIYNSPITSEVIQGLSLKSKIIIARSILHCMTLLESKGIIHADIKLDNVLIKKTKDEYYAIKLIDFDASFFESNPPTSKELGGDVVYFAPESLLYVRGEKVHLSSKIDVFAVGVLLHKFFCDSFPLFDKSIYDYPHQVVLDGKDLRLDESIPVAINDLLSDMLKRDPEARPTFETVFEKFSLDIADSKARSSSETKTEENQALIELIAGLDLELSNMNREGEEKPSDLSDRGIIISMRKRSISATNTYMKPLEL